jgi:hypothetical protein
VFWAACVPRLQSLYIGAGLARTSKLVHAGSENGSSITQNEIIPLQSRDISALVDILVLVYRAYLKPSCSCLQLSVCRDCRGRAQVGHAARPSPVRLRCLIVLPMSTAAITESSTGLLCATHSSRSACTPLPKNNPFKGSAVLTMPLMHLDAASRK